jgi:hypothetical protein
VFDATAVDELIDALRQQAELLSHSGSGLGEDPLSYAWLSCLEAASTVGRVLSTRPTAAAESRPASIPTPASTSTSTSTSTEDLQEAYAAARAAAVTVRFSLFGRQGEHAGPVGPEAAPPPA